MENVKDDEVQSPSVEECTTPEASSFLDLYDSSNSKEESGIIFKAGSDLKLKIAYAGKTNKKYVSYFKKKIKPILGMMGISGDLNQNISEEKQDALLIDTYAHTIVLNGWVRDPESKEFKQGLFNKRGEIVPFSPDNVERMLKDFPHLFEDLQEVTSNWENFKEVTEQMMMGN